jgi:monomeric sarcosine oxidase
VKRFDVIVVGAGIMGAAAARSLAQAGKRTLILEQFRIGHKRGSSHGPARIFRLSYPELEYVSMAHEALALWRELEQESGRALLTSTGGLDVGPEVDANAGALEEQDVQFRFITPEDASDRWPFMHLSHAEQILFQPDAGVLSADEAVRAFASGATRHGAVLHEETPVQEMEVDGDAATIKAAGQHFAADTVVVTAGAWAKSLLEDVDIDLPVRPTRETVAYWNLGDRPPTLVEWGDPSVYSLWSPVYGLRAGEHIAGPHTDPDEQGRVNDESIGRLKVWIATRFPRIDPEPVHTETCLYTNTDDERFILERHGRVVVGSPCSGHGFKFAPVIGKRLADMATESL